MWHVYQLHSDTELLYVGNSRWLTNRLGWHRRNQPWWPEVTGVRSEEFASEDEARQREKEVWASERPKYNKYNPFRTVDEFHATKRDEQRPRSVPYMRQRRQDPEFREQERREKKERRDDPERHAPELEYSRWYERARRQPRRRRYWPQSGPGLF